MKKAEIHINKPIYLGLSILESNRIQIMIFGMIMSNQNMTKKQSCVIWIQAVSSYT